MKSRKWYLITAVSDIAVVLMILFALIVMYCGLDIGVLFSDKGISMFRYYTVDANFFTGAACLVCAPMEFKAYKNEHYEFPLWAVMFKFIGIVSLALTFLVVVFFLIPMFGIDKMTEGSNVFMHFVIPVWCMLFFCLSGQGQRIRRELIPVSILPTVLYGIAYLIPLLGNDLNSIIPGKHQDWYGFAQVGPALIAPVFLIIIAANYLIARGVWKAAGGRQDEKIRGQA